MPYPYDYILNPYESDWFETEITADSLNRVLTPKEKMKTIELKLGASVQKYGTSFTVLREGIPYATIAFTDPNLHWDGGHSLATLHISARDSVAIYMTTSTAFIPEHGESNPLDLYSGTVVLKGALREINKEANFSSFIGGNYDVSISEGGDTSPHYVGKPIDFQIKVTPALPHQFNRPMVLGLSDGAVGYYSNYVNTILHNNLKVRS